MTTNTHCPHGRTLASRQANPCPPGLPDCTVPAPGPTYPTTADLLAAQAAQDQALRAAGYTLMDVYQRGGHRADHARHLDAAAATALTRTQTARDMADLWAHDPDHPDRLAKFGASHKCQWCDR
jgi:hypothetical protein